jgi:plasmid stabilization system protein ParE
MPKAWSAKRERQYEHIKDSEKKEGRSTKRAKEIAARTVNKQRAQSGETKSSSSSRGGGSSSRGGGRTKEQLYNEAKRLGIEGRSRMNKEQLQRAVSRKK